MVIFNGKITEEYEDLILKVLQMLFGVEMVYFYEY